MIRTDNILIEFKYPREENESPLTKTVCSIKKTSKRVFNEDLKVLGIGIAICLPTDEFSKPIGRKIALNRALHAAKFNKNKRRKIWDLYFEKSI